MNILVTFDNNYVEPALEMLHSVKLYNDNLIIHIIYDNLSIESIDKVKKYIEENNIGKINFYYYNTNDKDISVIKTKYITKSCYLRLYAPYIIKDIDKFLYLDPDIVCQSSLEELYNTDFKDNIIVGCYNMLLDELADLYDMMLKQINLPKHSIYINSGVLLIDTNKYREYLTIEQLDKFLEEKSNELEYHDQDAINYLFNKKIKVVENTFNYQINSANKDEIDFNKTIIHYSEKTKPWHYNYERPERAIPYYELLYKINRIDKLKVLLEKHNNTHLEIYKLITKEKDN